MLWGTPAPSLALDANVPPGNNAKMVPVVAKCPGDKLLSTGNPRFREAHTGRAGRGSLTPGEGLCCCRYPSPL